MEAGWLSFDPVEARWWWLRLRKVRLAMAPLCGLIAAGWCLSGGAGQGGVGAGMVVRIVGSGQG